MRPALQRFTELWLPRIEAELERILPRAEQPPEVLHAAMRYALFPGGKRLRPVLALLGALATGGDPERALRAACALELLHTYSLVHDDLPCMDDDDLRRGRPTCHLVYGEAVAVLVGDALLTLALELAAEGGADAVRALARAAGSLGMVGGQAADVLAERAPEKGPRDEAAVRWIHDHKTAALITAALEVGARAGGGSLAALEALCEYGSHLGRAFQIADDCLDVTATPQQLGKGTEKDAAANKLTYPSVLGLERSLLAAHAEAEAAMRLVPAILAALPRGATLDSVRALLEDAAFHSAARKS
jgi:geranylgeranyl pyrophosphate synthase